MLFIAKFSFKIEFRVPKRVSKIFFIISSLIFVRIAISNQVISIMVCIM